MTLTRFQSETRPGADPVAPKVHLVTFGCQMNKYDSLLVEGRFLSRGYAVTEDASEADVILFNTCSVRGHAEERTFSWLGELKAAREKRPDLVIGVMGCMAQRLETEIFRRAGHVDIVCGTRRFQDLPELVDEVRARRDGRGKAGGGDPKAHVLATETTNEVRVQRAGERYTGGVSGYLAVMRGCNLACTYCVVPGTRGPVRSRPIGELVEEARWMVDQGARAITLLGQTVNAYGEDAPAPGPGEKRGGGRRGRPGLADVLRAMQEIDGLARVRLVTLHPAYATQAMAEAIADCDKVERFLPLPVQSGSNAMLKAMRRGYNLDLYRRRMDLLREVVPGLELGTDWIIGFCGETDADHAASAAFLAEAAFAVNYIFKYDPREGTPAFDTLPDDVPADVKKERHRHLLDAAEVVQRQRLGAHRGATRQVLVERTSERDADLLTGRTEHGLPVAFAGASSLIGTIVPVRIEGSSPYGLSGTLAEG
jgi:tRNA-2-methylthio-N6-dimethylallyladenosine synthase